jgi:hypothetical protein
MSKVLEALRRANGNTPGADTGRYIYDSMMSDIRLKARDDARAEAAAELSAAEARADVHKAEISRLEGIQEVLRRQLDDSASDLSGAEDRCRHLTECMSGMQGENEGLRSTLAALKQDIARLEGEIKSLKAAPKPEPKPPAPIIQPAPEIPGFEISDVRYGGANNRVVSATIKPMRTN